MCSMECGTLAAQKTFAFPVISGCDSAQTGQVYEAAYVLRGDCCWPLSTGYSAQLAAALEPMNTIHDDACCFWLSWHI